MPRKQRFYLPKIPVHVVQRGHSREPVFFDDNDYEAYLHWLGEGSDRYHCTIHAYVLMTNHIHLLVTPAADEGVVRLMQYLGRHYVPYINYRYGTSGSIWEGRYKANLVQDEGYLLTCMRYIEQNPVRAKMVKGPSQYRWSSYRANGQGKPDALIKAHEEYRRLGRTRALRCEAYRELFSGHIETNDLKSIRAAWQTGTPLGNDVFREKIERKLKCQVGYARRGRPKKIFGDKA